MPAPRILAYQPETAVAEKIETAVSRGATNSRLKDYYDVWMLSRAKEYDGRALQAAFAATFERRGAVVPTSTPEGLGMQFAEDPESRQRWRAFRSRLASAGIETPEDLSQMVTEVEVFVMPPMLALAESVEFDRLWIPGKGWHTGTAA